MTDLMQRCGLEIDLSGRDVVVAAKKDVARGARQAIECIDDVSDGNLHFISMGRGGIDSNGNYHITAGPDISRRVRDNIYTIHLVGKRNHPREQALRS